jgi:branched-chain amino acid transport system substrate-binding protein
VDRRTFLAAAGGGTLLGLAGCGSKNSGGGVVKIVSSMPRTGTGKGQTDAIANGIRMAIDDYEGQLPGMRVEYQDWDDATAGTGKWTAELESQNARNAEGDPDVMAYLGPYNSGAAMVSMPILNEAGVVQVSPACTWTGLTKNVPGADPEEPGKYRPAKRNHFARVCPNDRTQGPVAADFAKRPRPPRPEEEFGDKYGLGVGTVYILDDKELYGLGVSGLFERRCREIGVQVLGHESINPAQQEFTALLTSIKAKNPDAVFFGGTTATGGPQIAKDMNNVGLTCPLIVPDGCYELSFITSAGEKNLANCYATFGGLDPSAGGVMAKFAEKYRQKYNAPPESFAIYGYEAANVVLAAIKKVGKKDREAILKEVLDTNNFEGVLGKWSFDPSGDITLQQSTISKIEGGKFKPVAVINMT